MVLFILIVIGFVVHVFFKQLSKHNKKPMDFYGD